MTLLINNFSFLHKILQNTYFPRLYIAEFGFKYAHSLISSIIESRLQLQSLFSISCPLCSSVVSLVLVTHSPVTRTALCSSVMFWSHTVQ